MHPPDLLFPLRGLRVLLKLVSQRGLGLGELAAAGDRWAPDRLRGVRWTQREIRDWGIDCISRLKVRGHEREIDRLTRTEPLPLLPGQHWTNGPPAGYEEG